MRSAAGTLKAYPSEPSEVRFTERNPASTFVFQRSVTVRTWVSSVTENVKRNGEPGVIVAAVASAIVGAAVSTAGTMSPAGTCSAVTAPGEAGASPLRR